MTWQYAGLALVVIAALLCAAGVIGIRWAAGVIASVIAGWLVVQVLRAFASESAGRD